MTVYFLKFIHILFTLGLLGSAACCLILVGSRKFTLQNFNQQDVITLINKIMLMLALCAMLTGTFLVYPKHFTFHTLWIQAAYVLLMVFSLGVLLLILFKKKRNHPGLWRLVYFVLITILIFIIHDAVTKTTFLF